MQLNIKKQNSPIKKMGQKSKYTFPQRRNRDSQKALKRCSTSLVIREMQIKTSHHTEWPSSKSLQTVNAREGVEKRAPSYTVGGNVNWYSHYGQKHGFLKN